MKRPVRLVFLILVLVATLAFAFSGNICRFNAREAALKQDLFVMRQAIDQYTLDKKQPPQTLQDLVDAHYLREIPTDPFTRKKDWVPHFGNTVLSPKLTTFGLNDV